MTQSDRRDGPVLIELDDTGPSPADVPPVAEPSEAPTGQAMQTVAALTARGPSALARWFWRLLATLIVFFASVALWDWVTSLVARNEVLGWAALGLVGVFLAVCGAIITRVLAALAR